MMLEFETTVFNKEDEERDVVVEFEPDENLVGDFLVYDDGDDITKELSKEEIESLEEQCFVFMEKTKQLIKDERIADAYEYKLFLEEANDD